LVGSPGAGSIAAQGMNSSQTKLAAWSATGVIGFGLFVYVAWFVVSLKRIETMVTPDEMQRVLENVEEIVQKSDDIISYPKVEASLIAFDWSGRPKELAQAVATEPEEIAPSSVPMAELVKVMFLSFDSAAPEESLCILRYTPEAQVRAAPPSGPGAQPGWRKSPGDKLEEPLDHVRIHAVRPDGVEFAFSDPERANEVVAPGDYDLLHIVKLDSEFELVEPESKIPVPRVAFDRKAERTFAVDSNTFQIGVLDAQELGQNYAEILAAQPLVDHRDPTTGKRDGIQLLEVKQNSVAAQYGLGTGDIIKSINGHPVTSQQEAITFVKNNKDVYDKWEVVIVSKGREKTIVYYPPQK
jgi:hypothetical protein